MEVLLFLNKRSTFALSTDVSVKDSDGRRPEEGDYAVARHRADLPAARLCGESAARRALGRLQAKKVQSAVLPMVVENRAAGRLLSYLLGSLMGGALSAVTVWETHDARCTYRGPRT